MRRYLRCPRAICCPARRALRAVLQPNVARIRNDGLVKPASAVDADAGASREVLERAITPHLLDDVG